MKEYRKGSSMMKTSELSGIQSWAWWLMPVIPGTWEVRLRVSRFQGSLGKK
jgi:hypothetical protein